MSTHNINEIGCVLQLTKWTNLYCSICLKGMILQRQIGKYILLKKGKTVVAQWVLKNENYFQHENAMK